MNHIDLTLEQIADIPTEKILGEIDVPEGYEFSHVGDIHEDLPLKERWAAIFICGSKEETHWICPFPHPLNEPLWVREEWKIIYQHGCNIAVEYRNDSQWVYFDKRLPIDDGIRLAYWQPPSTMPQEFSRYTITIKSVEVVEKEGKYFWEGEL